MTINYDSTPEEVRVLPATQALVEKEDTVTFNILGKTRTEKIISIDEACSKCWPSKDKEAKDFFHNSKKDCQKAQKADAEIRGSTKLICPKQFLD